MLFCWPALIAEHPALIAEHTVRPSGTEHPQIGISGSRLSGAVWARAEIIGPGAEGPQPTAAGRPCRGRAELPADYPAKARVPGQTRAAASLLSDYWHATSVPAPCEV